MEATARQPAVVVGLMEGLADPTRLRLLHLLERHELGVTELCDVLQLPQSTVSRHLKLLADHGLVQSRSERTSNFYRMPAELSGAARRFWQVAREHTDGWATLRQDQIRLARRLEDRSHESQRFFAGAASRWETLRGEAYGQSFLRAALLPLLPEDWVVADLGCGTASLAAELAPHVRTVIAVDQSAAMLRAARKRTDPFGNVELRQGRLEALPIEAAACDAALMLLVLTYLPDAAAACKEAARVLRPGGRLVVVDVIRHDRQDFRDQMGQQSLGFELPEIAELLESAGLSRVACRELSPEPSAKGPALFLATARAAARSVS